MCPDCRSSTVLYEIFTTLSIYSNKNFVIDNYMDLLKNNYFTVYSNLTKIVHIVYSYTYIYYIMAYDESCVIDKF